MASGGQAARADVYCVREVVSRHAFADYRDRITAKAEVAAEGKAKGEKMNRCETCKHWGSTVSRVYQNNSEGIGGQRMCGRIVDAFETEESQLIDELAYTEDGDTYHSEIRTKADFGCVLWEAKQTAPDSTPAPDVVFGAFADALRRGGEPETKQSAPDSIQTVNILADRLPDVWRCVGKPEEKQ